MILLIYLLKLVTCTALFYGYYFFFLRNKRMHQYNRFYLLLSLALSIVLPVIKIPLFTTGSNSHTLSTTLSNIAFGGWENEIIITAKKGYINSILTAQNIIISIYVTGLLLALYPVIKSLAYIRSLSIKHKALELENIQFYDTAEPGTPFSFFNTVFWNSNISIETEEGQQIFRHELYHIKQKHSYDILFMQLAGSLLWFNPFCYLLNKELKVIHEFLADEYAASGTDKHQYAELLVMQAISPKQIFISNQFFYNQIKRRIAMILQNNTNRYSYIRKAMAIPVVLLMFCACSSKSKDEAMVQPVKQVVNYDATFTKVEIEASYPGGAVPWIKYLNKNFKYPKEAQDNEVQGTVLTQFIVEKDGQLSDIHTISSGDLSLSKEALRMITQSGKWEPARQNGKIVRSYKIQPITFKLERQ